MKVGGWGGSRACESSQIRKQVISSYTNGTELEVCTESFENTDRKLMVLISELSGRNRTKFSNSLSRVSFLSSLLHAANLNRKNTQLSFLVCK